MGARTTRNRPQFAAPAALFGLHGEAVRGRTFNSSTASDDGVNTLGGVRLSVSLVAVVEDDPRVLGSLESLLASAGYDVLLFSSAEAFLSSDRLHAVDCLISDIGLPGMNGIDLLRQLRSRGIAVRSFFITGRKEDSVLRAGLAAGALRTFLKPFDGAELLNSIAAL